jgi:cell division septum initiation protein DivIVA
MSKNEKTSVFINDVEYKYEDMTQEQQVFLNHVADLDRKLNAARFNVDQLQVGRNAFMQLLEDSLKPKEDSVE